MGDDLMADVKIIPPTRVVADKNASGYWEDKPDREGVAGCPHRQRSHRLDENTATFFAGDLVVTKHVPVLDGSLLGWLTATDDLALIPARRVLPGHGPAIEDWPGALADQRRYLERLTQDTRGLISRGAPLAVAARTAGLAEKDRWDLSKPSNARNATAAFAELEWE